MQALEIQIPKDETTTISPQPLFITKEPSELQTQDIHTIIRFKGGFIRWIIVTISYTMVPFVNLILLFFQPAGLASSLGLINTPINDLGQIQDFTLYYVVMALYLYISATILGYTWYFTTFMRRIKLIFMVDHLLLVLLASNVCYTGLQILCFGTIYNANPTTYYLHASVHLTWQDVIVIILYWITNFILVGSLRVFMLHAIWKPWQVIVFKLATGLSSIMYFVLGMFYLSGKDNLAKEVEEFVDQYGTYVIQLFADPTSPNFALVPQFQNYISSMKQTTLIIANFTVVYLIANFTLFFELIHKLSHFDGTDQLQTHYRVQDKKE